MKIKDFMSKYNFVYISYDFLNQELTFFDVKYEPWNKKEFMKDSDIFKDWVTVEDNFKLLVKLI